MILEETKGLPSEALNEILDFIKFIKAKSLNSSGKHYSHGVEKDLMKMNQTSLTHLEEKFADYKKTYPHE